MRVCALVVNKTLQCASSGLRKSCENTAIAVWRCILRSQPKQECLSPAGLGGWDQWSPNHIHAALLDPGCGLVNSQQNAVPTQWAPYSDVPTSGRIELVLTKTLRMLSHECIPLLPLMQGSPVAHKVGSGLLSGCWHHSCRPSTTAHTCPAWMELLPPLKWQFILCLICFPDVTCRLQAEGKN